MAGKCSPILPEARALCLPRPSSTRDCRVPDWNFEPLPRETDGVSLGLEALNPIFLDTRCHLSTINPFGPGRHSRWRLEALAGEHFVRGSNRHLRKLLVRRG
jgi:hypothetical protein